MKSWLRKLFSSRQAGTTAARAMRRPMRRFFRPGLEKLETRLAPATATLTFDFATIGGAGQAATLKLASSNGTPTLEVVSGGGVVASKALSGTSHIVITGEGNDNLTLDFTTPFAEQIQYNFKVGGNTLGITGSAVPGTYTPTAGVSGAGQIQVGSNVRSTITFSGASSLSVSGLSSFLFTTPGGGDNVTVDSPSAGVNRVSGTSAGTAFVPVTFSSVTAVTINTAVNDTASSVDTVTIESPGLVASGLQNFTLTTGSGNSMLLDYAENYSLPVSGGTFAFNGGSGTNSLVGPSPSSNPNPILTNVGQSIPVPVVILPGFLGSFATPDATAAWFSSIGLPPSEMEVDPIESTYASLVLTLENFGYVNGQTLFQAPWDWRLPVAPQDGTIDGVLSNLTVAQLTGGVYRYAVDYLGNALVTAAQAWATDFDGRSLPAVNVVTHSTGGNIARAYIQSPAYGGTTSSGLTLPKINDFTMMAGANQGSPDAFDVLNNNLNGPPLYRALSLLVGAGYQAVLAGATITDPNGNIDLASITVNGQPSIQKFLQLGCASLIDLLPTYPFLNTGSGPLTIGIPGMLNNLTLDMNDGLGLSNPPAGSDPNLFLDSPTNRLLGTLLNEYSTSVSMEGQEDQEPAGHGTIVPLGSIFAETPTTIWYQPVDGTDNGDDTLTLASAAGQFLNSDGTLLQSLTGKVILDQIQVPHEDLPSDSKALADMLTEFGQNPGSAVIAQGGENLNPGAILERVLSLLPKASFSWHGITFDASQLQVAYNNQTDVFTLTGPSSLTVPGIGTINIDLGSGSTAGLVVTGYTFTSFEATISGNLTIGGLTIQSNGLELTYVAGNFEIEGAADFTLGSSTVDVILGGSGSSGLVLNNGTLASLDMTINSNITIGGVSFSTTGLTFTYDAAANVFTVSGTAGMAFTVGGQQVNLQVSLGTGTTLPGLVVQGGDLQSLTAPVKSDFNIMGLDIAVDQLTVAYDSANGDFTLDGSVGVSTSSFNLSATFGDIGSGGTDHGIVIQNGELQSLYIVANGGFTLGGLSLQATAATIGYDADTNELELSGGVRVALSNTFAFSASIASTTPLFINTQTGAFSLSPKGLDLSGSLKIGSLLSAYVNVRGQNGPGGSIDLDATGLVTIANKFTVNGEFKIDIGQLSSIELSLSSATGIEIGTTGFYLTSLDAEVDNFTDLSQLSVSGHLTVSGMDAPSPSATPFISVTGPFTVNANGLDIQGNVSLEGGTLGTGEVDLSINWFTGVNSITAQLSLFDGIVTFNGVIPFNFEGDITLNGVASINVPDGVPFIGGDTLGNLNFYLQVRPGDSSNSFVAAWTTYTIPIIDVTVGIGFEYNFDNQLTILGGPPPEANVQTPGSSPPTTFTVSNTSNDANVQNSLPWAIAQANGYNGSSTIQIDVSGSIDLASTLDITTAPNVSIVGPGATQLTIDGGGHQVFNIGSGAIVSISDLTITDGGGVAKGGGINNAGTLLLSDDDITGSSATSSGGGIWNSGTLTLSSCNVLGNTATNQAGGIYSNGSLYLSNTTVFNNNYTFTSPSSLPLPSPLVAPDIDGTVASSSSGNVIGVADSNMSGISNGDANNNQVGTVTNPINPFTYTVTATTDFGDGSGQTGDLRYCVNQVNTNASEGFPQTIQFAPSLAGHTITLTGGPLELEPRSGTITINGGGVTISGGGTSTVFKVDLGTTAVLTGLTITKGHGVDGGGIFNLGTLTVNSCILSANTVDTDGAGIFNQHSLTLINSTISGNSSSFDGGGIFNDNASLTVSSSTIDGNSASLDGGGIFNNENGNLTVSSSTINGNSAGSDGGGILNENTMTLSNDTISGSSAGTSGGGIYNRTGDLVFDDGGPGDLTVSSSTISRNSGAQGPGIDNENGSTLTLNNTIVAGNAPGSGSADISGSASGSNNLIGIGTPGGAGQTVLTNGVNGNQVGTSSSPIDPMLGPLANNGGPTQTMALLSGSPAIGAGSVQVPQAKEAFNFSAGTTQIVVNPLFGTILPDTYIQIDGQRLFVTNVGHPRGSYLSLTLRTPLSAGISSDDPVYVVGTDQRGVLRPIGAFDIGAYQTVAFTVNAATDTGATGVGSGSGDQGDLRYCVAQANAEVALGLGIVPTIQFAPSLNGQTITLQNGPLELLSGSGLTTIIGVVTLSGGTTNGSNIVSGLSGTSSLSVGVLVTGAGTPAGDTVAAIGPNAALSLTADEIQLSAPATATAAVPLAFGTNVTISGGGSTGVFLIDAGAQVDLTGLTISDGSALDGGGIDNAGTLALMNDTISSSSAQTNGGAIYNTGTLTLTNATLSGNHANFGGGIYNTGTLSVSSSTISSNSAHAGVSSADSGGGIYNTGTLTLTNATLTGNHANNGGGIYNTGTLSVSSSTISGSSAGFAGGGIYNRGNLTVNSSTFASNHAVNAGGIYNDIGRPLTVTSSTFNNSSALFQGGAITNWGTLSMSSSTIANSSASSGISGFTSSGGGIWNHGTLTLSSDTISGNSAGTTGGGIYNKKGTLTLQNTIVAGNTATTFAPDIWGSASGSNNLIGDGTGMTGTGISNADPGNNQVGTSGNPINPMLGSLADNGGPTETMALLTTIPPMPGITTNGSSIVSGLNSTSSLSVGMLVTGDGIPVDDTIAAIGPDTVLSLTADEIELSAPATATAAAVLLAFDSPAIGTGALPNVGQVAYDASAGATTILLNDPAAISPGESIVINGQQMEVTNVTEVSYTSITVSSGISAAILSGDTVNDLIPGGGFFAAGTVGYGASAGATTILLSNNSAINPGLSILIDNQTLNVSSVDYLNTTYVSLTVSNPISAGLSSGTPIFMLGGTDQRGAPLPASSPDIGAYQTQVFTVTTNTDSTAGVGSGFTGDLRYCVALANADAANGISATINFAPSLDDQIITLQNGPLELTGTGSITIDGGSQGITVAGANFFTLQGNTTNGSSIVSGLSSTSSLSVGMLVTGANVITVVAALPGDTTSGSAIVSGLSSTSSLSVGMLVRGANITTVVSTMPGDTTSGSAIVSELSSTSSLRVGMQETGAGIPVDDTITAIGPNAALGLTADEIELSAPATATAANVSLTFATITASIPVGDTIAAIGPNAALGLTADEIELSAPATATAAAVLLNFDTIAASIPVGDTIAAIGPNAALSLTADEIELSAPATATAAVPLVFGATGSVFKIDADAQVALIGLTISNGNAAQGGGINNAGTLTLTDVTLSGNFASSGAGVYNSGSLTLSNTTLEVNTSTSGDPISGNTPNGTPNFAPSTPHISPLAQVNITYGVPLANFQLNGTATVFVGGLSKSVAGTFTYTSAGGTVLGAGNVQIENVIFTPSDTTDYTTATSTVTVNVARAVLTVTASANNKTYGATASDQGMVSGVVNNDGITASFSSAGDAASAPVDGSPYLITATLSDPNSKLGNYTVIATNNYLTVGQATLTYMANTASLVYGTVDPVFNGSVTGFVFTDTLTTATTGTLTFSSPATSTSSVGSYAITGSGLTANHGNYVFVQAAGNATALTIKAVTTANLETTLASQSSVTLQVAPTEITGVISAINALPPSSTGTITLNLTSGSYTDLVASPPANVTLVISGAGGGVTFLGQSPALTVTRGMVVVKTNVTFSTITNSPTILVSDGSLTLRGDTVQESTGGNRPALLITGGTVDLGTATDPGNNTFNVNGPGLLLGNKGSNPVSALGDTFQVNGVKLTDPYRIADLINDGLDSSGRGLVTFVAQNAFVLKAGSIQRAIHLVPAGYTINVQAGFPAGYYTATYPSPLQLLPQDVYFAHLVPQYVYLGHLVPQYVFHPNTYTVGSKPLTIAFQNGPTISQQSDPLLGNALSLFVQGTAGNDTINFLPGSTAGQVVVRGDNLSLGTFAPTGRLVAHGMGGTDVIKVSNAIRLPAWLYADGGNALLEGGGGKNVLVGGSGNDVLEGGLGRAILIGGAGRAVLKAGPGGDLLIGGTTTYDSDETALLALSREWASAADYVTRIGHLTGALSGGLNGSFLLNSATVSDNGARDVLLGGSGRDLFFAGLQDEVTGTQLDSVSLAALDSVFAGLNLKKNQELGLKL